MTSDAGFAIGLPVTFMALLLHGRPRETQRRNTSGQTRVAVQHIRRRFPREARKLPTIIVATRADDESRAARSGLPRCPDVTVVIMEAPLIVPVDRRHFVVSGAAFDRLTIDIQVHQLDPAN